MFVFVCLLYHALCWYVLSFGSLGLVASVGGSAAAVCGGILRSVSWLLLLSLSRFGSIVLL